MYLEDYKKILKRKEKLCNEAIKRMEMLGLDVEGIYNAVDAFKDGKYWYSDRTRLGSAVCGILYEMPQDWVNKVKEIENKYNIKVYHATHEYTDFGECLDLLFVSSDEEEWKYDRTDIKCGYVYAYVINLSDDTCSEFGGIGVKMSGGGLVRVS